MSPRTWVGGGELRPGVRHVAQELDATGEVRPCCAAPELVIEPGLGQLRGALLIVTATIGITFSLQARYAERAALDLTIRLALAAFALVVLLHPSERVAALAHAHGALVLFDGTQAVVHRRVDVQAIGADFYTWTGHKLYGPTGIGVLWARKALLEAMPPFLGGGDMIGSVSFERSTWAEVPHKFEAGTPPILEAVGLTAAIEYVEAIGFDAIAAHEAALTDHALARLGAVPGLRVLGTAQDRGSVFSFTLAGAHAHDVATLLDRQGIAVRAGYHCAEPLMRRLGVDSTARASCGIYTTHEEIDVLADTLDRVREFFS